MTLALVNVHPLVFEPILMPRLWGGQALRTVLGKACPAGESIGESWELADLPQAASVVARGPLKGRSLRDLVGEWGRDLTGRAALFDGSFPLLIKFLDAREVLSVQVHPDADLAARLGVRLKHEAWYVVGCTPQAVMYKGLKPGVSRDAFVKALQEGRCADLLNSIPVRPGQCHYLPSGTVHALGAGVLVAEIQTPSDVTYRLFDWGRTDPHTGRPRELHIEQALQCMHFGPPEESAQKRSHIGSPWTTVTRLVSCPSFVIEKVRMVAGVEQRMAYGEPVVWIILTGRGRIAYGARDQELSFAPGDTVLLPAALADGRVRLDEDAVWLEVTIPTESDLAGFPRPDRTSLQAQPGTAQAPIQINIERDAPRGHSS
jgi:mannose-6-phosphate isomerase